jgi:hypothetical protein
VVNVCAGVITTENKDMMQNKVKVFITSNLKKRSAGWVAVIRRDYHRKIINPTVVYYSYLNIIGSRSQRRFKIIVESFNEQPLGGATCKGVSPKYFIRA